VAGDPLFLESLRRAVKNASKLSHSYLATTFGVGVIENTQTPYVVFEWVDGIPLPRWMETHAPSLRLLAKVCQALHHAHPKIVHGALRPNAIWINRAAQPIIIDFGLAWAHLETHGVSSFAADQDWLAPELSTTQTPTMAADIFGIGGLAYYLSSHRHLSERVPDTGQLGDSLESLIARCLETLPSRRIKTVEDVQTFLSQFVDFTGSIAPTSTRSSHPPFEISFSDSLPPAPSSVPEPAPAESETRLRVKKSTLESILADISKDDAHRWMVHRNGLEHGPFSAREVIDSILKGETREDTMLRNTDTGEFRPAADFPHFTEFILQYKTVEEHRTQSATADRSAKFEKRANLIKIAFGSILILVVSALGYWFISTRPAARPVITLRGEVGDLYDGTSLRIEEGSSDTGRGRPSRGGRRAGHAKGGGGGGQGSSTGGSYEDVMSSPLEMGDVSQGGGEQRLTTDQIARVFNQRLNSFQPCVQQEIARGQSVRSVTMDLAIVGSGKVAGVSVHQGSEPFRRCISGKAKVLSFPQFSAPRMGTRYTFHVD